MRALAGARSMSGRTRRATSPGTGWSMAATDDPAVNAAVYADGEAAGVWVNSADDPTPLLLHPAGGGAGGARSRWRCPPAATARRWPRGCERRFEAELGPEYEVLARPAVQRAGRRCRRRADPPRARLAEGPGLRHARPDQGRHRSMRQGSACRRVCRRRRTEPPHRPARAPRAHDGLRRAPAQGAGRPASAATNIDRGGRALDVHAHRDLRGGRALPRRACQDVRNFLAELGFVAPEDFSDHLYSFYDDAAVAHLFRVAAGLDSAVLGESEILGQVRDAWQRAAAEGAAGAVLAALFRHAVEVGKRARSETGHRPGHRRRCRQAAVAMAADRLGSLDGRRILVLGAGEMGEGMAVALAGSRAWPRCWSPTARGTGRRRWRRRVGGRAVQLGALADGARRRRRAAHLDRRARRSLVEAADLAPVMAARPDRAAADRRRGRAPRRRPRRRRAAGVTLLDMDDLRAFAEQGLDERRREIAKVRGDHRRRGRAVRRGRRRPARWRRWSPPCATGPETLRAAELERFRVRLGRARRRGSGRRSRP